MLTRRSFLRAIGLGAAAAAAPAILMPHERRIWQVGAAAPVRAHEYGLPGNGFRDWQQLFKERYGEFMPPLPERWPAIGARYDAAAFDPATGVLPAQPFTLADLSDDMHSHFKTDPAYIVAKPEGFFRVGTTERRIPEDGPQFFFDELKAGESQQIRGYFDAELVPTPYHAMIITSITADRKERA